MTLPNEPRSATAQGSPLPIEPKPAPSFTITLVEDDLVLVWSTQSPQAQADILARLSAWLRRERTKANAL
jgi:hypothetical protein